jgi:large subunit ribosomal protein L9
MNVILLKDVEKLGLRGEVVNVARGYARNYLLPRNLAEVATEGRVKEVKRIDAQKAMHEARSAEQAAEIAETLGKLVLRFDVKSGPTGSLFGSVTTTDIADEIWRIRKIRVDRRKIGVDNIKRIGRYTVPIDLFEGVSTEVKLMVVPEGGELPPEEELAAMEAAELAAAAEAAAAAAPASSVDESAWEEVDDAVVLDDASLVEVTEDDAGEITDVVVVEGTADAAEPETAEPEAAEVEAAPEAVAVEAEPEATEKA